MNRDTYDRFAHHCVAMRTACRDLLPSERLTFARTRLKPALDNFVDATSATVCHDLFVRFLGSLLPVPPAPILLVHGARTGFAEFLLANVGFYCELTMVPANHTKRVNFGRYAYSRRVRHVRGPLGLADIRSQPTRDFIARHVAHACVFFGDAREQEEVGFLEDGTSDETRHLPWLAAQTALLLQTLQAGGTFVLSLADWFLPATVEVLSVVSSCCSDLEIHRSPYSPVGAADAYAIGRNFKPPADLPALLAYLQRRIDADPYTPLLLDTACCCCASSGRPSEDHHRCVWCGLDAVLARAQRHVEFRLACLNKVAQGQEDDLAQPPLDPVDLFVYAREPLLPASGAYEPFLGLVAKAALSEDKTMLLAALVSWDHFHGSALNPHFVFADAQNVYKLECGDDFGDSLLRDFASFLAPGSVVQVRPLATDSSILQLLRILSTAEHPMRFQREASTPPAELYFLASCLPPDSVLKLHI